MKIRVKDIEANPFRDLERNPVRQDKVDALKSSITDTGFWDNVVVRPKPGQPGKYQVAYGHHRLFAVRDLGIAEIDCPVKEVSDGIMLKMMTNENRSEWSSTPATVNESVWAVKNYFDERIEQFENFEELEKDAQVPLDIRGALAFLFEAKTTAAKEGGYARIRVEGVGIATIQSFLGDAWGQSAVEKAMSSMAEDFARIQSKRLKSREARAKAKEEAARLESERLAKEEEDRKVAEAEAKRLAEEAAQRDRLAKEAEEKRKAEEAAEQAKMQAIKDAEAAEKAAAKSAKDEADKLAAQERQKVLAEERKAEESRRAADKARRDAEKARIQKEAKAADAAKREADRIAKAAKEAREKAQREAKEAEKARKAAQGEAEKREAQRKAKEKLLADLESEGVDRYAYELFENQAQAGAFRAAAKEFVIPKSKHRDLAQSIVAKWGDDASALKVTQEVRSYAVLKGYWQERDRVKTMRELLKQETFDSKWSDVGGNLQKAIKDIRFILMQVDKVMGNERELDSYDLFELFSEARVCNYIKSKVDEIVPLLERLNFSEVKREKDVTPASSAPVLEIIQ